MFPGTPNLLLHSWTCGWTTIWIVVLTSNWLAAKSNACGWIHRPFSLATLMRNVVLFIYAELLEFVLALGAKTLWPKAMVKSILMVSSRRSVAHNIPNCWYHLMQKRSNLSTIFPPFEQRNNWIILKSRVESISGLSLSGTIACNATGYRPVMSWETLCISFGQTDAWVPRSICFWLPFKQMLETLIFWSLLWMEFHFKLVDTKAIPHMWNECYPRSFSKALFTRDLPDNAVPWCGCSGMPFKSF